jgi:hypothetical protein
MEWRNMTSALANAAWRRQRPKRTVETLAPYFRHGFWGRHKILTGLVLALIAATYGLIFGVTATAFLVQILIPVAIVAILIVGLLPESGVVFERSITALFFAFFFALAVWPDYLAFAFGGLPWITAVRLIAVPLSLLFLISLSQSQIYRSSLVERLNAASPVWMLLLGYFIISLITIGFSNKPMESVNKYIVAIYAWGAVFLVAVQVFVYRGRTRRFAQLLWVGLLITCLFGFWEYRIGRVPWAGHVPSFLKIEDEMVARVLSGASRAAIGEHRVQGKFTTPLGLAEFLALVTPFILHFLATGRNLIERGAAAMTLLLILFLIDKTDSRLGVIGFLLAGFGYVFFWTLRRWQRESSSLFAPMIVVGYPAMMTVLLVASFFVTRLKNMIWGGGAYQASNEARENQIAQGMDIVMRHPWGHGIGRAAETLGYTNLDGFITIDTYYLSIALEAGVIGFIAYYGAFVAALAMGSGQLMKAGDREETSWLLPALLSLGNYVVIKSVLSQQDNHPLAFCVLGMAVALIYQIKQMPINSRPGNPQKADLGGSAMRG